MEAPHALSSNKAVPAGLKSLQGETTGTCGVVLQYKAEAWWRWRWRCVAPVGELDSAVTPVSGPRVQLGLRVRSRSSVWEVNTLKAGNEAVGLKRPLLLPPCKNTEPVFQSGLLTPTLGPGVTVLSSTKQTPGSGAINKTG